MTHDERFAMWLTMFKAPVYTRWHLGWQIMEKESMPPGHRFMAVLYGARDIEDLFESESLDDVLETIRNKEKEAKE